MANRSKRRIKHDLRVRCAELTEQLRLRNAIEYGRIHRSDEYRVEVMACEANVICPVSVNGSQDAANIPEGIRKTIREQMASAFLADENGCVEYRVIPEPFGYRVIAKMAVLKPKGVKNYEG